MKILPSVVADQIRKHESFVFSNYHKLRKESVEILQKELVIVENHGVHCPMEMLSNRELTTRDLDKFYDRLDDSAVIQAVNCKNNFLMYQPNQFLRTHRLLNELRLIGGGIEGNVMMSQNQKFIVKNSKDTTSEQLIHEYFVGAFGTNHLRSKIPNFSAVLGYFKCTGSFIESKQVISYCLSQDNPVSFVLYEPIQGDTLRKFVATHSLDDILQVLTGLILALEVAYREIDFTHYDLHDENILIKELPEIIAIPYQVGGRTVYLHTKYVPTIIDYGRGHIKYNGNDFGYEHLKYFIAPDRSFPMYDVYKVLMFTINTLRPPTVTTKPSDKFITLLKIVYAFNDSLKDYNSAYWYLSDMLPHYYTLPFTKETNITPFKFFLDFWYPYFKSNIDLWLGTEAHTPAVYGCTSNGTCISLETAIHRYTTDFKSLINDVLYFYDVVTVGSKKDDYILMGKSYYQKYFFDITNYKQQVLRNMGDLSIPILSYRTSVSKTDLFNPVFMDRYTEYIRLIATKVNLAYYYSEFNKVYTLLLSLYTVDDDVYQRNADLDTSFNELVHKLDAHVKNIQDDIRMLVNKYSISSLPKPLQTVIKSYQTVFFTTFLPESSSSVESSFISDTSFASVNMSVDKTPTPNYGSMKID